MSNTVLEQARVLHEEIEALEKAVVTELDDQKKTHRQSIEQEHRILAGLKGSQKRARALVELYDDKDKLMIKLKSEIGGGGYNNEAFYKRYRATNQYYARYPNATAQADPTQVAAEVLKATPPEFTQEEGFGRHFDVLDLFARFRALPQMPENITATLTYTQYLTRLSVFHDIPVKHAEFASYVTDLRDYLLEFAKRVKPLVDHNKVVEKIDKAFEEEWTKKAVPGWEKTADAEQSLESVDLNKYVNAKALESLGADFLRMALQKRGLKFGGSVADRAKRLFLVKDLSPDKYPKKLRAKPSPASAVAAATNDTAVSSATGGSDKALARVEFEVGQLVEHMVDTLEATKEFVTKKQTRTIEELEAEMAQEEELGDLKDEDLSDEDDEEEDNDRIANPHNVPLDYDGKPIPYWLFKLHGLDKTFDCEICGNFTYRGRRAYDRHFQEWRHAHNMRVLGIPNTRHLHDITKIQDAKDLFAKLKGQLDREAFQPKQEEQFEDSSGNVLSKRVYEDLKRQNLL